MIELGSRDMDLYPLPLFELPVRPSSHSDGKSVSRRVAQRYSQRFLVTQCVNNTITALNDLSTSFSDDARASVFSPLPNFLFSFRAAKSISLGQQRVLNEIIERAVRLVGRTCDDNKLNQINTLNHDHNTSIFDYHSNHTQPRVPLVADTLSLPVKPGSVPLLSSLPPHASAMYADVANVLASPQLVASRPAAPAPTVFASGDEYVKVINRMRGLDMIDFTLQPRAVNGLFGIDKGDGTQRLIFDARAANNLFVDPPSVSLPTPDKIASLRTQLGAPVYVAKVDLDNFFHRFVLPEQYRPFFALPAVRAGDIGLADQYGADTMVFPCASRLPMGWSHSVFLAQSAHECLIERHTRLRLSDCISVSADTLLDRLRFAIYIDDLSLFSTDPALLAAVQDEYIAAMEAHGLPVKTSKVVRPCCTGVEVVGLEFDGTTHHFGLSAAKMRALVRETWRLLDAGLCTGLELSSLVGKWTWACLANRPALSCFSAVYRFINIAHKRVFGLWPTVRRELLTVAGLAPLLSTFTAATFFPQAVATDASSIGLGVTAAHMPDDQLVQSAAAAGLGDSERTTPAQLVAAECAVRAKWSTLVAARWRRPLSHINEGEARAVSTAVRWASSRPAARSSRLLLFCDSTAVVGALCKGRSSSPLLLRRLRQISAFLFSFSLRLHVVWLPSELNPADYPSRNPRQGPFLR